MIIYVCFNFVDLIIYRFNKDVNNNNNRFERENIFSFDFLLCFLGLIMLLFMLKDKICVFIVCKKWFEVVKFVRVVYKY